MNTKPKIFIAIHYMELGGAETSLLGLLQTIDYNRVDVDLFIYSHQGPLMELIPKGVNLLSEIKKYSTTEKPISQVLRMGYWDVVIGRLLAKYRYKRFRKKHHSELPEDVGLYQYMANYVTPLLPNINSGVIYDLAINFCGMQNVILDKVRAKKKLSWIHTDYTKADSDRKCDLKVWSKFDRIISISEDVTKTFCQVYPNLSDKIDLIENILSPDFVLKRSVQFDVDEEMPKLNNGINLLSIGRFTPQKNFENIPNIAKKVLESGITNLKWYIIGYGNDSIIKAKIKEEGMENEVIILGKKDNPYPYIKACDFYVQPSRFEGKCVTVREAQILGKPVIVTQYPTASSQVRDKIDGFIVPLNNEDCAREISSIIKDESSKNAVMNNLSTLDFTNVSDIEKFYKLAGI